MDTLHTVLVSLAAATIERLIAIFREKKHKRAPLAETVKWSRAFAYYLIIGIVLTWIMSLFSSSATHRGI